MNSIRLNKFMKKVVFLAVLALTFSACSLPFLSRSDSMLKPPSRAEVEALAQYTEITATMRLKERGSVVIKLLYDRAPYAVTNFVKLSEAGYYKGMLIDRVIPGLMIETGSFRDSVEDVGSGYIFDEEISPSDDMHKGAVAMSNSGLDANGSRFFIILSENGAPWLEGRHTIFGEVSRGIQVAEKIVAEKVDNDGSPLEKIVVENVFIDKISPEVESEFVPDVEKGGEPDAADGEE